MRHAKYITFVLFLALAVLAGTPEEPLSCEQSLSQGTADGAGLTLEPQQAPTPALWRHPLARVTKRRVDPSPLSPATCGSTTPSCHLLVGHPRHFSITVGDYAVPLYQSLRVYRC